MRLQLNVNAFVGPIPPEIGNLNKLISLSLSENRFSGHIPIELSKLSLLQGLALHDNVLEGTIPDKLSELKQLTQLLLHENKLVGQIPDSISTLEMLSHLDLHGNKLNGSIPKSMGKLDHLLMLDLSHNQLTGSIPGDVIAHFKDMQMYLNLSYNHFVGNVPSELGMLDMVQAIDVSNNNLSGVLPKTLVGCRNMFSLDFSGNNISGPIPAEIFSGMDLLQSLNLSRNHLDGEIPKSLSQLKNLSSLDLSQNNLKGSIPEGFANLSSLMQVNFSFNQLEGPVPLTGIFAHMNASSMMGNQALCGAKFLRPCRENDHSVSKKAVAIIAALGSLAVLLLVVLLILYLNRGTIFGNSAKTSDTENHESVHGSSVGLKRFSPKELEYATGCFSSDHIIGATSLSTVYKGQFEDGQVVAVKSLNLRQFSANTDKIFKREASTLCQLRHRNLVKILGYAWESQKIKALVLEYMENGNLDSVIHDKEIDQSRWTLSERVRVFISIASGLDYLHSGYGSPIVHCDLKPSNILLDRDFEAHVSDFGTSRILGLHLQDGSALSSTAALQGTVGYLAPGIRLF
jgi:LRR receptor-like serine/threonine-protein kinase FLS2